MATVEEGDVLVIPAPYWKVSLIKLMARKTQMAEPVAADTISNPAAYLR
jgi:hypothetical protein